MINQQERKWVQDMLAKAANKEETKPSPKNDANHAEVEQLTDSIRRRLQRGE